MSFNLYIILALVSCFVVGWGLSSYGGDANAMNETDCTEELEFCDCISFPDEEWLIKTKQVIFLSVPLISSALFRDPRTVCGGSIRTHPSSTLESSLARNVHHLTHKFDALYRTLNNLANGYVRSRIHISTDEFELPCVVQMSPGMSTVEVDISNLDASLTADYDNVLHMVSIIHLVSSEDNEIEFQHEYTTVVNILYDALCAMNNALRMRSIVLSRQPQLPEVSDTCNVADYLFGQYVRDLRILRRLQRHAGDLFFKYNNLRRTLLLA